MSRRKLKATLFYLFLGALLLNTYGICFFFISDIQKFYWEHICMFVSFLIFILPSESFQLANPRILILEQLSSCVLNASIVFGLISSEKSAMCKLFSLLTITSREVCQVYSPCHWFNFLQYYFSLSGFVYKFKYYTYCILISYQYSWSSFIFLSNYSFTVLLSFLISFCFRESILFVLKDKIAIL